MTDEVKEDEAEDTVETPLADEAEENTAEEEKKTDDTAEAEKPEEKPEDTAEEEKRLYENIQKAVDIAVSRAQKSKEVKAKEKALNSRVSVNEPKIKIYTKSNGEKVEIERSKADILRTYFSWMVAKSQEGRGYAASQSIKKLEDELRTKVETQVGGTDLMGGFLIPDEILANILVPILEDASVIMPRSTVIDMSNMKSDTLSIPTVASKPYFTWAAEAAQKGTSTMTFGQFALTPYTVAAIVVLTNQLRDDSPFDVVSVFLRNMAEGMAKELDRVFTVGSGSAQPTGIENYTLPIVNAGGALSFTHLNDAFITLPQAYRSNAVWIMNGVTIATIMNLVDGNSRPLIEMVHTQSGFPEIKGRPVLEQNDLSINTIKFGDLSQYYIATKGGVRTDISSQATVRSTNLWERNEFAIRMEQRIDGELATTRSFVEINAVRT